MNKVIAQPEETVTLTVCIPISMRMGLSEASRKICFSKPDIVRSLLYDFLVGGNFMQPIAGIDGVQDTIE